MLSTTVILMVTVLAVGQAPVSYQTKYDSRQSCEEARVQVVQEHARKQPPPKVTAVCKAG